MSEGDGYFMDEFYEDLWVSDATESWLNGGYDENGEQVYCDVCGEEMSFDNLERDWKCDSCGNVKSRAAWFDYLEASPPGIKCLTQCQENYPLCKKWCLLYDIDPEDPIL